MAFIAWGEWLVEKIAGRGLSDKHGERVFERDFQRQMRRKLSSRDPYEVSVGQQGLAALRRSNQTNPLKGSTSLSPRPSASLIFDYLKPRSTSFSSSSSRHPSTPSSPSTETSTRPSTGSSTDSSASSSTSLNSSSEMCLASIAHTKVDIGQTSISTFPSKLRKLITPQKPPTRQLDQVQWILRRREGKHPRLTPYWPKATSRPIATEEANRKWQIPLCTSLKERHIDPPTSEFEHVSHKLPSKALREQETSEYLVKLQPPCETIGGDRYRCYKNINKFTRMKRILKQMGNMADICGMLGPDVEVRGFPGLTFHDLLRMKYTKEIKEANRKPTEELSSSGIHITRGFNGYSSTNKAENLHKLLRLPAHTFRQFPPHHRPNTTHTHHLPISAPAPLSSSIDILTHQNPSRQHPLHLPKPRGFQTHAQPPRPGRVLRKPNPLETLRPLDLAPLVPLKRVPVVRQPTRLSEHVADQAATSKANRRVRWKDEVEESALGATLVEAVAYVPSGMASWSTLSGSEGRG